MQIEGSYDPLLILTSYLIASLAAYAALDFGARVSIVSQRPRVYWLLGGAAVMGLGIWSMHFVGMFAFKLPIPVDYENLTVFLSLLWAILASGIALYVASRKQMTIVSLTAGSLCMGGGIIAMHYTGMAAMDVNAILTYDPLLFTLSILIAFGASAVALWLTFRFRTETGKGWLLKRILSCFIMGIAISGMHYTGMAASRFEVPANVVDAETEAGIPVFSAGESAPIAYSIALATFMIFAFAVVSTSLDRRARSYADELARSQQHYQSLFENNSDAVFRFDLAGRIQSINPAGQSITGLDIDKVRNTLVNENLVIMDFHQTLYYFNETISGRPQKYDMKIRTRADRIIDLRVTTVPIMIDGACAGFYAIAQDITEQNRSENRIRYLAYHDEVTSLGNRRFFTETLEKALTDMHDLNEADPDGPKELRVLMMVDIDRFNLINNTVGQALGNRLLTLMAQALYRTAPSESLICRMGSDEFAIFLPPEATEETARQSAESYFEDLPRTFELGGREVRIRLSAGYALAPVDGSDHDDLLRHAETALGHSKKLGKHRLQHFDASMNRQIENKLSIERKLSTAFELNEYEVHYQAQFDLSGKVVGAEALVRWNHNGEGYIPPGVFIPVAEESGIIHQIGDLVMKTACSDTRVWQSLSLPPIVMSVNLSIRQFEQDDLVARVAKTLAETGLDPGFLKLEITESMAMDVDRTLTTLANLRNLGIGISMDDFGTGYSSLSYLNRFPINTLKIDQSFVREIKPDRGSPIVETIIVMAHNLGLTVVAEGVETHEQLAFLRTKGCDQVQGFLYGRPMSASEFERFLRSYPRFTGAEPNPPLK